MKYTRALVFLIVSLFFFYFSFDYELGTVSYMGPAFFPRMISVVLFLIGVITLFSRE